MEDLQQIHDIDMQSFHSRQLDMQHEHTLALQQRDHQRDNALLQRDKMHTQALLQQKEIFLGKMDSHKREMPVSLSLLARLWGNNHRSAAVIMTIPVGIRTTPRTHLGYMRMGHARSVLHAPT